MDTGIQFFKLIQSVYDRILFNFFVFYGPVCRGCIIYRLHLCRGIRIPIECSGYDTKQSDGEDPVMQELWRMRSNPSLPLLPAPLMSIEVALDSVLSQD